MKKFGAILAVAVLAMAMAVQADFAVLDVDWTSTDVYANPGDVVRVGVVLMGLGGYGAENLQVIDSVAYWDPAGDIDLMVPSDWVGTATENFFYLDVWNEGDPTGGSDAWWGDPTNPSMMSEYDDGFNVGLAWYRASAAVTPDGWWWAGEWAPQIGDLIVEWDIMISPTATPGTSHAVQLDHSHDRIDWVGYDGFNPAVPAGNTVVDKWYDVIKTGDAGALTVHIIPEPVTMSIVALGGVVLLKRRKK